MSNNRPRKHRYHLTVFGTAADRALAARHAAPYIPWDVSGAGACDMVGVKKSFAVDFINQIRTMDSGELNALIVREAGEELAQFFLHYSANLISRDPERVIENTSSLMLMGYLIRAAEERRPRHSAAPLQA